MIGLSNIQFKIGLALVLILLLAIASLAASTMYYRGSFIEERAAHNAFVSKTEAEGKQAEKDRIAREEEWKRKLANMETSHEKNAAAIRARFARELGRVRGPGEGNPGEGGLPEAGTAISVCSDEAGNHRLRDALFDYRRGVLQLLETCEVQTSALVWCQERERTLTGGSVNE